MLSTANTEIRIGAVSNSRLVTAAVAAGFGAFTLFFALFAQADVLHNSTHDTRHAVVAPCH